MARRLEGFESSRHDARIAKARLVKAQIAKARIAKARIVKARIAKAGWSLALVVLVVALIVSPTRAGAQHESATSSPPSVPTAIYYGRELPRELLAHYDRVVVDPDAFPAPPASPRAQVLSYVAVGEVNPSRPWYRDVPRSAVIGKSARWGSEIVDTTDERWRAFLLDRVIEPLWKAGYRAFFFDTLDSYVSVISEPARRHAHARSVAMIIRSFQERHRDATVVLNRGFDALPFIPKIDGLVAESLYSTCDSTGRECRAVPSDERRSLLSALAGVRKARSVPITIVDYVPSTRMAERRATAKRIAELGFDPWVTNVTLDEYGVGRVEIVPRRILVLHSDIKEGSLGIHDACVLLGPVLEWLGYAVEYADVRKPLPSQSLAGRYAGIVTMLFDNVEPSDAYRRFILAQLDAGLRVAFIEGFGFEPDAAFLARLGLSQVSRRVAKAPVSIARTTDYFGFEAPVRPRRRDLVPVVASRADVVELLRIEDADGAAWSGAVLAPWGGAVFSPHVLEERLEQERRWIVDPFKLIEAALALTPIPAPDVTTESGRRILTVHVDGDAFVSRAERRGAPFTSQVVHDELLRAYEIPHTVSVVEGEISPKGVHPQHSAALEAIARMIFALPNVEVASHTYSHPFVWGALERNERPPRLAHLPIPGYTFDVDREIRGSVAYVGALAPPGKHVKVLLWSGDCTPSENAVALAKSLGLFNVNGGGATRTKDLPSLTRASPMGIPKAPGIYQVFSPVENENVFTNDWLGPYDGYRHAIETFELNESPRRLSPISIYYHFYSAAKTASLRALKSVYAWALGQETTPLYLSEYAAKVEAFQEASLARRMDGAWEVGNLGALRELRVDRRLGWPMIEGSIGLAGARDAGPGRYAHLSEERDRGLAVLSFATRPEPTPRLLHANGRARSWSLVRAVKNRDEVRVRIAGNVPLEIAVAARAPCQLFVGGKIAKATAGRPLSTGEHVTAFALDRNDTGEARLVCE